MGRKDRDNSSWFGSSWIGSRWTGPVLAVATAGMACCGVSALAQHAASPAGHMSGPISGGHVVATRPIAPGRPVGTPTHSGQRFGTLHANSFGAGTIHANSFGAAASPPPPSWELPRTVTPHWEISPNIPIQPNAVQGNPISRQRGGFGAGVGYVGFPYFVDPTAFVNAGGDQEDDTAQQAQPNAPARPDYGPQAPYEEGPAGPYPGANQGSYSDQGYAPPRRAPYNPGAYPSTQNNASAQSAPAQSNGLDHPAVTLVFNDGRPPMQVHSYVLTSSSVLIAESGRQRVIPVTDLDLPATVAQNREAGVDFKLPGGGQ
jgi:hypothetical protein